MRDQLRDPRLTHEKTGVSTSEIDAFSGLGTTKHVVMGFRGIQLDFRPMIILAYGPSRTCSPLRTLNAHY